MESTKTHGYIYGFKHFGSYNNYNYIMHQVADDKKQN